MGFTIEGILVWQNGIFIFRMKIFFIFWSDNTIQKPIYINNKNTSFKCKNFELCNSELCQKFKKRCVRIDELKIYLKMQN